MGTMAGVRVNTTQRMILYRDFVIEEAIDGWEWAHEDYHRGRPVAGLCQTMFECIDAVEAWYDSDAASIVPGDIVRAA